MKILVTGGLGHIGSKLILDLAKNYPNSDITIIDDLSSQRYGTLFEFSKHIKFKFHKLSVQELDDVWIKKYGPFNYIIHLAAMTDAAGNANKRELIFKNNFEGTKKICDLAFSNKSVLIFPSSTSVYGSQKDLVDEECEDLFPQSAYAESKIAEEEYIKNLGQHGLNFYILRFGTIHGISAGMRFHTAVNHFIFQAALGGEIEVWRTALNQKRPYLSLMDCSRAISHVINGSLVSGRTFNIVTTNNTVGEILKEIEITFKKTLKVKLVDSPIMNQLSYEVSSRKFSETGFVFLGNLQQDIHDTAKLLCGIKNE